jgi:long-chain acyl-CoA synthetase
VREGLPASRGITTRSGDWLSARRRLDRRPSPGRVVFAGTVRSAGEFRQTMRAMSRSSRSTASGSHVGRFVDETFERHGDYDAIFFEGRWHTLSSLLDRARRIAGGFIAVGLQPGSRVVVTMPNCPDVPVLYNAIWRAGAVVTPAMFLLPVAELRHLVSDSGASFVVTNAELAGQVQDAVAALDHVEAVICVEPGVPGTLGLDALEAHEPVAVVDRAPPDLAALLYTGGTTGRSKGVMLSHANLANATSVGAEYERELRLERELMALPLSHSFGLLATLGALRSATRKSWIMLPRFDASAAVQMIDEHRVDFLQAVPSMLQLMLAEPLEDADLSSLRVIFSGAAPLPPESCQEFERRVPSVSILEGYGLTETSTLLTGTPPGAARAGSVGTALPGVEIRIVDAHGHPLAPGDVGEICTRSPAVMTGYWNAPEATAAALSDDGWLATGDVGYVDADGYVFILDRKKDLIIRGGFNVYPRDVEDALLRHPAVRMAAVIGKPDPIHGEEVVAFVSAEASSELTSAELVDWAREHIGGYKYPREVRVVDQLPLTDVGKVDRKAIRRALDGQEG